MKLSSGWRLNFSAVKGWSPLLWPAWIGLNPRAIPNLAAWYDAKSEASTTSDLLRIDASNRVSLIADKSGNSATNCFVSNVAASQTMTAANKSVTGNQTFTLNVGLDDYTPGADQILVNKLSGNDGFSIVLLTTGVIRLRVGNGASVTNVDSTTANTLTDRAQATIGIVWTDGVGASFTQNGSALGSAVAAAVTLTNAATSITIGSTTGRIYRVQVGSVYDCNPSLASKLASSFSSGGDTWTVNSSGDLGARISGERDLVMLTASKQPIYTAASGGVGAYITLDGSDDYMANALHSLAQPYSGYFIGQQVSFTNGDIVFDGSSNDTIRLLQATPSPQVALYAGGGASAATSEWAIGTSAVVSVIGNGASSGVRVNRNAINTANIGTGNPNGITIGARRSGASPGNIRMSEFAIYSAAHSTPVQDRLIQSFGSKWGIST